MKVVKTWIGDSTTKYHIISLCRIDDKTIAMGGQDKLIRIYEWESDQIIKTLKGHKGGVNYIIILSDDVIASCGSDNSIIVWNWKTELVLNHLLLHHA